MSKKNICSAADARKIRAEYLTTGMTASGRNAIAAKWNLTLPQLKALGKSALKSPMSDEDREKSREARKSARQAAKKMKGVSVLSYEPPKIKPRDPIETAVDKLVLEPLRVDAVMAMHGLLNQGEGGSIWVVISKTEEALRNMTRCSAFPEGLDFSSQEGAGRAALYRLREEIQLVYGLYFIGEPRAGLKFTVHPIVGMQWRETEFNDRAKASAQQLQRMWALAFRALGDKAPIKTDVILPTARERTAMLERACDIIQSSIVVDLSETRRDSMQRRQA